MSNHRGTNIRPKLVSYFIAHPNNPIDLEIMAQALGESDLRRVASGVSGLLTSGKLLGLRAIAAGHCWEYRPDGTSPEPTPDKRPGKKATEKGALYEQVGTNRAGRPIVRDEDGILYEAVQV